MKEVNKLPECCYAVSPYTGSVCLIYRGDNAYYGAAGVKSVDAMNEKLGVSKAQAAAMKAAMEHGWESPQADPAAYDQDGNYVGCDYDGH